MNIEDLHPSINSNTPAKTTGPATLKCHCANNPVEVILSGRVAHNHLCGCSACWKPKGSLFSQIAVVAQDQVHIVANQNKLDIINESTAIKRYACKDCGVHMVGQVSDPDHHYFGVDFVHIELAENAEAEIEFASYVSSLIESGLNEASIAQVRTALAERGISAYDTMSPEIMDIIAYHKLKLSKATAV